VDVAAAAAFALVAAVLFAAGTVLLQKGTLQTESEASDPRFYVQILRRPIWLAGIALTILGGLCQLAALSRGPISVVQPITLLSLVFALPLGAWLTDQAVGRREAIGAIIVIGGLIAFLAISSPSGGLKNPPPARWIVAGALVGAAVAVTALSSRGRSPAAIAGLLGAAAGLTYGFEAAAAKLFTEQLGEGVVALVQHWSTYALILSALGGGALEQASLKVGVLAPAMAAINVCGLVVSVLLGVLVFDETLATGHGSLFFSVVALAVTAMGVVLLTVWRTQRAISGRR
jgi:uncharacterized membrane protein